MSKRKIICLVYPFTKNEEALYNGRRGSLEIIGTELYHLLKQNVHDFDVDLWSELSENIDFDNDVLLLLCTIDTCPYHVVNKFRNVAYWFDDVNIWKLEGQGYVDKFPLIKYIFHPVFENYSMLKKKFPHANVNYVPWSIAKLPDLFNKTEVVSYYLDVDERPPVKNSIQYAMQFIKFIAHENCVVYLNNRYSTMDFVDLTCKIVFVPDMGHDEFLNLISTCWFYVSGIAGSYEYSVVESALLGCGLINLNSALPSEHTRDFCYLNLIEFSSVEMLILKDLISLFNYKINIESARVKYPNTASSIINSTLLLERID